MFTDSMSDLSDRVRTRVGQRYENDGCRYLVMQPLPRMLDHELSTIVDDFMADCMVKLWQSAMPKEPSELTENERFAVAYFAGVPIHWRFGEGDTLKAKTNPCAIAKVGGKFIVGHKDEIPS